MEEQINAEAKYCLNCATKPCQQGCPLHIDTPSFIHEIKRQDYKKAYEIISRSTVLPSICGRICPHMKQCQARCTRGIKGEPVHIGELEAFVGDIALKNNYKFHNDIIRKSNRIAIIGGGPAGLSCGAFLALDGFNVTIYEVHNCLGGILSHGIPEFRISKAILAKAINQIIDIGIEVKYNQKLGENIQLSNLTKEYDAIFLGLGANEALKMEIEGELSQGVYTANKLLEDNIHPNYTGKKVAIIGGGNVAIDCARVVNRKGAKETKIIYRRDKLRNACGNKRNRRSRKRRNKISVSD